LLNSSLKCFGHFMKESKARLDLLHVRTSDEVLDPLIDTLKINGKKLEIDTIHANDVQSGVKKYCLPAKIDLIAVISKKHSAFYNFFTESNTKKIAFAARIPVMSIHE
jgi:hypothetical protein